MQLTKKMVILLFLCGLQGCSEPKYTQEQSAFIVWKTPSLRYADQGFIATSPAEVKAEIYSSGQPLLRLRIGKSRICASFWACLPKSSFNARFLSRYYPPETLEQILRGQPIFGGIQIERKRNGFTQKIYVPKKYKIDYQVLNNQIVFRDTINEILLKVNKQ
jgi:hypothetical protein